MISTKLKFPFMVLLLSFVYLLANLLSFAQTPPRDVRFTDITQSAGIHFVHNNGAFGGKYLPETLGPGCAFIDYDGDGYPDILLINGEDWSGHLRAASTLHLNRNNRTATFTPLPPQPLLPSSH